ncbi:hypothetical protein BDZ97DRAFT_1845754, partial [Flammula alnicola]
ILFGSREYDGFPVRETQEFLHHRRDEAVSFDDANAEGINIVITYDAAQLAMPIK